jgi:hypothetical protein
MNERPDYIDLATEALASIDKDRYYDHALWYDRVNLFGVMVGMMLSALHDGIEHAQQAEATMALDPFPSNISSRG